MSRLQSLTIDGCPFLMSLPGYLLPAPLLKELEISGSQLLKERFQRGTGENFKISHISNIKLDWVYVQRDGEPQFDSKVTLLAFFFFFLYFIFSFQIYQLNINIWIGL